MTTGTTRRMGGCVGQLLPVEAIAVHLADEGVPLRAIARAVNLPSSVLRLKLRDARDEGLLVDLPQEDWPPGFPRDQRALQLSRMVIENRTAVLLAMQQVFGLTSTEVTLLLTLIQHESVPHERVNMAQRTINVHVCRIRRRLAVHGIEVATIWGYGYRLSVEARRKIMDMILARLQDVAA